MAKGEMSVYFIWFLFGLIIFVILLTILGGNFIPSMQALGDKLSFKL
jgi:hypothetical protein